MKKSLKKDSEQIKNLIELNDELENYFRNTVIPQLFVDANFILRKFTPPAMKQFNFTPTDIGKNIKDLISNIRFPTLIENIKAVVDSKEVFAKEIQTNDLRWFQMDILPYIVKKDNHANGVIITFIDITERINTLKEVEVLNADHETFIYSVSHDLKAPVLNIIGLIEALHEVKDKNSEEALSLIEMINSSADNVENIIDELGDLSKKRYIEKDGHVNFEDVLEDVKLTLKENILKSRTVIKTEINVSGIEFARKNIRSILYNLLNNAIKYKAAGRDPEILVKTEKISGYVLLSVQDNGAGIPDDKKGKIFSEFTRLTNSVEGTGIGLYLVSKIVDSNGGKIEVESTLGQGTTFNVYFKTN